MENKITSRGRPKKYITDEEKLIMGRVYCKKYNDNPNNKYHCIECNKYIHPASKIRHMKTLIHQLNSQKYNNE